MGKTPTFFYPNLNTGLTPQGAPVPIDDLWNPNATALLNGTAQYWKSASDIPFRQGDGTVHSASCWFKATGSVARKQILAQADPLDQASRIFEMYTNANEMKVLWASGNAGSSFKLVASSWLNGTGNWNDGAYHHILASVMGSGAGGILKLYLDGFQVAYGTLNSLIANGGYTGPTAAASEVSVGAFLNGGSFFDDTVARPKFWRSDFHNDADALIEYNEEVAAIGEGLGGGGIVLGGQGRNDFRANGMMHQLEWNRGAPRFSPR